MEPDKQSQANQTTIQVGHLFSKRVSRRNRPETIWYAQSSLHWSSLAIPYRRRVPSALLRMDYRLLWSIFRTFLEGGPDNDSQLLPYGANLN